MFGLPLLQSSLHVRTGAALWLAEGVATFGLLLVVIGHRRAEDVPWMIAAWIGAAYWFTASTSFANPAITIARSLSDTFAGIRPDASRVHCRAACRCAPCVPRGATLFSAARLKAAPRPAADASA